VSDLILTESAYNDGGDGDVGFRRPRGAPVELYERADRILAGVFQHNSLRARADLQEAMVAGDFRNAAFEIIDREMIARYETLPSTWPQYARRVVNRDFKPKQLVEFYGGMNRLSNVPELTEYPEEKSAKTGRTLTVSKRGKRRAFSWEAFVNDELDELANIPDEFALAARETEASEAASLLTDGTGPNNAFFNATAIGGTVSNLMTGNPALSTTSLQTALATIRARVDPLNPGRPVSFPRFTLVVPSALSIQAMTILNATQIMRQEGTGDGLRQLTAPNWMSGVVDLAVEPWLDVLDTGPNKATTWYIVPTPSTGRYALAVGFLRGHEQPQIRIKANQGNLIGGGAVPTTDGSFEIDDVQYRIRHVLGSGLGDPLGTIASQGNGS
jgi:hypothetical protein